MFYWIFVKKDTYLSYSRKDFHNNFKMYKDILVVGIPASLEQLVLSVLTILVGTAAISVAGVAYGARKYENLRVTARYAVKVALIASIIVCIILYVFANQIALIFSYSENSAGLAPLIAGFLQIMCLFILYVPFGASAGNVFQGVGKGTISFFLTTFREFILVLIFAYLLGFTFHMGEFGIYCGMLLGGGIGSLICYACIELYINKLIRGREHAV